MIITGLNLIDGVKPMSVDLETLRQRLMEAAMNGISPGQVFKELGITPDNPEVLQALMAQAGFDLNTLFPDGQVDMPGMVNNLTKDLSPEVKQQLSQVIHGLASEINNGQPLPPDVEEFLKGWGNSD
ncbi:hypothetical protein MOOTH_19070 [Moorella thermoacetica]|uniref:Uncharacterized protein n=2 Tax=Neomoorella thermoacetica TaxID=1525 RepID=A0A1J5JJH3_NEOTH|nr:hypothetical protein MOOR_13450 [Moorella thermoacetica]OIQ11175.1 hypothetical protein MOOTH_19070 [Moorella thermoacetica]OIQ62618.1 hypothetical protein MTIN_00750 [Moorella thermoacetica]